MAFQFNQPQQQAQPQQPAQGIASLPAQSSAQGGFAFQPRAAVQHPNTLPQAQPLTNEQMGIRPAGAQNQGNTFANSMQAWQAARQAELAGLVAAPKPAASSTAPGPDSFLTMSGPVNYGRMGTTGVLGAALTSNQRQAPPKPVAPTVPNFTLGTMPTEPQQYMSYVAQQQAEFEKQKAAYQKALDAYKG